MTIPSNRFLTKVASHPFFKQAADAVGSGKGAVEGLRPKQEEALTKLEKNHGIILHHKPGSGKTRTFLEAVARYQAKNPGKKALIVAPASLVTNVDKELDKHGVKVDRANLDVYSYEKATRMADELGKKGYGIAIADEAHKLRNADTKRTKALKDIFVKADQRILSTGTANYNHAADLAPLMNIAAGKDILPENRSAFEDKFISTENKPQGILDRILRKPQEEVTSLKNTRELKSMFAKHVHDYDPTEDPKEAHMFPKTEEKTVEVEMSPEQKQMYAYTENQLPFWLKMKVRHGIAMDKQERAQLNSFSSGVRQVSNSHRHLSANPDSVEHSPKIQKAVESLTGKMKADKNFRGVVYSNYLDAGVKEYARKLEADKVPHRVFHGGMSKKEKDEAVKDYNEGRAKVLLISSSGAEGLDLKGTKLTQVLEPHFNPSKINQVIGRGSRYGSHAHLSEAERKHEVEHYLSVLPKNLMGKAPMSIDKYLHANSGEKQEVFDQIQDLMKKSS